MEYKSGQKNYTITPSRQDSVLRIAKRNYPSAAKSVVDKFSGETIKALATKINKEINNLCSSETITVFKKGCENIDSLWKQIWSDINLNLPTLVSLLVAIGNRKKLNKPLICMMVSMMLKHRYDKMSLTQGIISVLLYGNSVNKQVR